MPERTTQQTVTFRRPFALPSVDEQISAGTYIVDTVEEAIEGTSFVGYRRLSTSITIETHAYGARARQVIEIDPRELEYALRQDQEQITHPAACARATP